MTDLKLCSVEGCGKPHAARGWCKNHYYIWKRRGMSGDPTGLAATHKWQHARKFFELTVKSYQGDQCLFWPFATTERGHAKIGIDGKTHLVARLVCEAVNGEPPSQKHEAAHSCGNGDMGCVASKHLRWATHTENMADRKIHGTHLKGETQNGAKLTEAKVREIRELALTMRQCDIADKFGVCRATICNIVKRNVWEWLE